MKNEIESTKPSRVINKENEYNPEIASFNKIIEELSSQVYNMADLTNQIHKMMFRINGATNVFNERRAKDVPTLNEDETIFAKFHSIILLNEYTITELERINNYLEIAIG